MPTITHNKIVEWLRTDAPERLEELWLEADRVRRECVGEDVHLRGLIEFGNYCRRNCGYCGLRAAHKDIQRYRMPPQEVVECAKDAAAFGYGTVVLQSGEDPGFSAQWLGNIIRRIKAETPLAVTLSVGERPQEDYAHWRKAGADRFLLRFETSDPELYASIHPDQGGNLEARIDCLRTLRTLGYEVGSGIMIGMPGQTYDLLADDIESFAELDLDMIGVGPFIPHPATPLGGQFRAPGQLGKEQVPADELMTYKVVALTRLLCPYTNIPSTTALATLNKAQGRELGLSRGANVVMPNVTPPSYRQMYEIYPAKACLTETAEACHACMRRRIESTGRIIGTGQGTSRNYERRMECKDAETATT